MAATLSLFGETSLTVVAGAFRSPGRAARVARALSNTAALRRRVRVIAPGDKGAARKFEPEQAGIWHTAVRSHLILGVLGLLAGLAAAWMLVLSWQPAAHSPGFTALFSGVLGAFFGMLLAGLVTLRPDRTRVFTRMHGQLDAGAWTVVAHPQDEATAARTLRLMRHAGAVAERSL